MKFRAIVSLFAGVLTCCVFSLSSAAASIDARSDAVITDMAQAFKQGDKRRLSNLLPQVKGHLLEPWAAYWELRARLDEASSDEIRAFLSKYAGTYQEDRLRNDWLQLLGNRRDWTNFEAEYANYRMKDDREVRCYALAIELIAKGPRNGSFIAEEVKRNWFNINKSGRSPPWQ